MFRCYGTPSKALWSVFEFTFSGGGQAQRSSQEHGEQHTGRHAANDICEDREHERWAQCRQPGGCDTAYGIGEDAESREE